MTTMTDARAVEVLAAMREDGGVVSDADYTAAIDHVIARMGEPAEAQAQGGGEVFGWVLGDAFVDARFWTADTPPQGWTPVYCTAPPIAPVGVDVQLLRLADRMRNAIEVDGTHYRHIDGMTIASWSDQIKRLCPLAQQPAAHEEMSPDFTDSARAAIAWVLYHHQGGSSPVGQPLRFALGMGADEQLPGWRIAEAKRWAEWAGATTADFHRQQPAVVDGAMVERAEAAATEYWQDESHATRCDKCNGTGEDRSVPDWCGACGGQGHYHAGTETGAMRAALTAALAAKPGASDNDR